MRLELKLLCAVVVVAVVSMAVFRAVRGRGEPSAEVARRGSFVLGNWMREWFYWAVEPVKWISVRLGLVPEVYNALGLALGIAAGFAFAKGNLPAGGALVLASGITDAFDGLVARARGMASDAGAFLDSTLDRFTELAAFIGLIWWYQEPGPVLVLTLGLGGSLLVSYTRARGESLGVLCQIGIMQRAERLLIVGLGSILDPTISDAIGRNPGDVLLFLLVIIAAGSLGTAIFRTLWITRRLKERE